MAHFHFGAIAVNAAVNFFVHACVLAREHEGFLRNGICVLHIFSFILGDAKLFLELIVPVFTPISSI